MARSGSLPWLLLAAVLCTLFAIFLEGAFLSPVADALLETEAWQTSHNTYAADGKAMLEGFVDNLLIVITIGIWVGVVIGARRGG